MDARKCFQTRKFPEFSHYKEGNFVLEIFEVETCEAPDLQGDQLGDQKRDLHGDFCGDLCKDLCGVLLADFSEDLCSDSKSYQNSFSLFVCTNVKTLSPWS